MQIIPSHGIACSAAFSWWRRFSNWDERRIPLFGILYDCCPHDFKSRAYCQTYFLYVKAPNNKTIWISSNIINSWMMNLPTWNKCILNSECITVPTLLLTYLEEKHSFGNRYLQFRENLTHWFTEYSNTNLVSCPVLEFHELRCALGSLSFIPQLEKMQFGLNTSLTRMLQEKTWCGCSNVTH